MNKLKGVVVGAGYFSKFHLEAWSRIDVVEISAICDVELEKAKAAAEAYQVSTTYTDYREMIDAEKPDFIDVVTRPSSHLEITQHAAENGVAIICQKPLASTVSEARRLVAVTEQTGSPLMVHDNFRFQPWYREIKELLNQNVIGDQLHSITVRTRTGDGWQSDAYVERQPYFRTMKEFLIFETGVHFIDTFRFLAGEIDGVYALLRRLNPDIEGEDAGVVQFEFCGGAHGLWDVNRFNEPNCENPRFTFGETLVEGNGGSIRLSQDGKLSIQPLGEPEREHPYEAPAKNFAGDCVYATQKHFIDCILKQSTFETNGQDYLRTLRVQEAVYESATSRLPVRGLSKEEPTNASD